MVTGIVQRSGLLRIGVSDDMGLVSRCCKGQRVLRDDTSCFRRNWSRVSSVRETVMTMKGCRVDHNRALVFGV